MPAAVKFFGLMFLVSFALMAGTALLIRTFTDAPGWVMGVSMPFVMLAGCAIGLYVSDWWLAVRGTRK